MSKSIQANVEQSARLYIESIAAITVGRVVRSSAGSIEFEIDTPCIMQSVMHRVAKRLNASLDDFTDHHGYQWSVDFEHNRRVMAQQRFGDKATIGLIDFAVK